MLHNLFAVYNAIVVQLFIQFIYLKRECYQSFRLAIILGCLFILVKTNLGLTLNNKCHFKKKQTKVLKIKGKQQKKGVN